MKKIFAFAFLSLCVTLVSAQVEGDLDVSGDWNFKQNNTEILDFNLKYKGKKFFIGTNIYFGHSYQPYSVTTCLLDEKKEENEYYKEENKDVKQRTLGAGASINFGYTFNEFNILTASIGYGYNGRNETSHLLTDRYNADRSILNGTQFDTTFFKRHDINAEIAYTHKFSSRPNARLDIVASEVVDINSDLNQRSTSGNFYPDPKTYATYGNLNGFDTRCSISYNDLFSFKRSQLKLNTGLDFISNQDLDAYNAATLMDNTWRDSISYRQSYFYTANAIEPYVNLTYTIGKFDIYVKERVQFYKQTLMDKLEEKLVQRNLENLFEKFDVQNLLNAGVQFRINEKHALELYYSRSISRPDYKKLCPTLMIGESEGEYIMGNPELKPEVINKVNLGYTYKRDAFVLKLDVNYCNKRNSFEKVIDVASPQASDPGVKTLRTWINNKRQDSFGSKLDFKMNGKVVNAEIWAGMSYDIYGNNKVANKKEFSYEIGTNVEVSLNPTTKLSSSLVYLSARESAYNLSGEDIIANLRFVKTVIKGLDIYVELNDIVDKAVYEETWNEDKNYFKIKNTNPGHRALRLGINYRF